MECIPREATIDEKLYINATLKKIGRDNTLYTVAMLLIVVALAIIPFGLAKHGNPTFVVVLVSIVVALISMVIIFSAISLLRRELPEITDYTILQSKAMITYEVVRSSKSSYRRYFGSGIELQIPNNYEWDGKLFEKNNLKCDIDFFPIPESYYSIVGTDVQAILIGIDGEWVSS